MNLGQKIFNKTPPLKGSFPLDHDGDCKQFMVKYMTCLKANKNCHDQCIQESKEYFSCRMENGLMDPEDFAKLGFKKEDDQSIK